MTTPSKYLTQQSGNGPVEAVDITKLPESTLARLVHAAIDVSFSFDNCDFILDEGAAGRDELERLSAAVSDVFLMMKPTVPGADLYGRHEYRDTYPVLRNGGVVQVARAELTPLELHATISRMRSDASVLKDHADLLAGKQTEAA